MGLRGWVIPVSVAAALAASCGGETTGQKPMTDHAAAGSSGSPFSGGAGGSLAGTGGTGGSFGGAGGSSAGSGGLILDASSGGSGGVDADACAASSVPDELPRLVDVVVVLQNADSMQTEAGFVQSGMNGFAREILATGLDAHFVIISASNPAATGASGVCIPAPLGNGSCPLDSKPPAYLHVDDPVGSNDALSKIINDYPQYRSALRIGSMKYLVVISDSDAQGTSAAEFVRTLWATTNASWRVFGIFCTGSCGSAGVCAQTGTVYRDLVQLQSGMGIDLCQAQTPTAFDAALHSIAAAMMSDFAPGCSWLLPATPPGALPFNPNLVNLEYDLAGVHKTIPRVSNSAACGLGDGWYYDDPLQPTRIDLCPQTCDSIGKNVNANISVVLGCPTVRR